MHRLKRAKPANEDEIVIDPHVRTRNKPPPRPRTPPTIPDEAGTSRLVVDVTADSPAKRWLVAVQNDSTGFLGNHAECEGRQEEIGGKRGNVALLGAMISLRGLLSPGLLGGTWSCARARSIRLGAVVTAVTAVTEEISEHSFSLD